MTLPSGVQLLHDFMADASKYDSVMDVGCGTGLYLQLVTARRIIGVDAHMPTLLKAREVCPNATMLCVDARSLKTIMPHGCVECITAMDAIEHLARDEAMTLLADFEQLASHCIQLFVPVGNHPQTSDLTGLGNDYWQTHRSTWLPEDFEQLGYTVTRYPRYHSRRDGKDTGAVTAYKKMR